MPTVKILLCIRCYHDMIFTTHTTVEKVNSHAVCEKCGKHHVEFIVEKEVKVLQDELADCPDAQ